MKNTILIIGSGNMGTGIGCCAALANNDTVLYDSSELALEKAEKRVYEITEELVNYGLYSSDDAKKAVDRITFTRDLPSTCENASLVIEAIFENLQIKQQMFETLDSLLPPSVPILSNTSGLRITDIAKFTRHPERTLTAHFWLPAHLLPLVEIVVGEHSSPELAVEIKQLLTSWGKSPVIVNQDLPGQLANRILQAVIREAVNIVEIGLASPEDVDTAIKMGMALRFPVWGPLEHVDAVGMDICGPVQDTVLPEICTRTEASPLFRQFLQEGKLGYKSGHGFYDWSKRDMDALVKTRNDFIVFARKQMNAKKE